MLYGDRLWRRNQRNGNFWNFCGFSLVIMRWVTFVACQLCCWIWLSLLLRLKEYKLWNSHPIVECRGKWWSTAVLWLDREPTIAHVSITTSCGATSFEWINYQCPCEVDTKLSSSYGTWICHFKKVSNLPWITQLINGRARSQNQATQLQSPYPPFHPMR